MNPDALRESIDAGDVDALRSALREDPSLVTALVAAPDIQPTSPLTYVGMARFYGYARHQRTGELAQVVLEAGADKDDEKSGSPLICAASHGDADVVRALLDAGADVELTGTPPETALRLAAAFGYPAVVDMLVGAGARPQSIIEAAGIGDLSAYDLNEVSEFDRACALRAASVNERLNVIDQLLAAGTPIDAEVDGHPAIHWPRSEAAPRPSPTSRHAKPSADRGEGPPQRISPGAAAFAWSEKRPASLTTTRSECRFPMLATLRGRGSRAMTARRATALRRWSMGRVERRLLGQRGRSLAQIPRNPLELVVTGRRRSGRPVAVSPCTLAGFAARGGSPHTREVAGSNPAAPTPKSAAMP
jgi:hypothetical protein